MQNAFRMIDVGGKVPSLRIAIAQGRIVLDAEAFALVQAKKLPKGDALILAEIAGIQGAKQCSQTIPLCHPLGLDHVELWMRLDAEHQAVWVTCRAQAFAKTGVEMEALAGVHAALLTLWDLSKMIQPDLRIDSISLLAKLGGKSGFWLQPNLALSDVIDYLPKNAAPSALNISAALITLSDRAHSGQYDDASGAVLRQQLESEGARIIDQVVLPDEPERLRAEIVRLTKVERIPLLITTGGTGLSPRDCTPEVLASFSARVIPGIGELLRQSGSQFTPMSWLSRSQAIIVEHTLIIALPGSPKAVAQGLQTLLPLLPHLLNIIQGGQHD